MQPEYHGGRSSHVERAGHAAKFIRGVADLGATFFVQLLRNVSYLRLPQSLRARLFCFHSASIRFAAVCLSPGAVEFANAGHAPLIAIDVQQRQQPANERVVIRKLLSCAPALLLRCLTETRTP